MPNSHFQEIMQNFYAKMYAWASQRATEKPHLKEYYYGRMEFYQNLMLQSTSPITIQEILA